MYIRETRGLTELRDIYASAVDDAVTRYESELLDNPDIVVNDDRYKDGMRYTEYQLRDNPEINVAVERYEDGRLFSYYLGPDLVYLAQGATFLLDDGDMGDRFSDNQGRIDASPFCIESTPDRRSVHARERVIIAGTNLYLEYLPSREQPETLEVCKMFIDDGRGATPLLTINEIRRIVRIPEAIRPISVGDLALQLLDPARFHPDLRTNTSDNRRHVPTLIEAGSLVPFIPNEIITPPTDLVPDLRIVRRADDPAELIVFSRFPGIPYHGHVLAVRIDPRLTNIYNTAGGHLIAVPVSINGGKPEIVSAEARITGSRTELFFEDVVIPNIVPAAIQQLMLDRLAR